MTVAAWQLETCNLKPETGANMNRIVERFAQLKAAGKTGVLVTHDVPCALAVGDRFAFLQDGKIAVVQNRNEIDQAPDERIAAYMNGDIA